MLQWYVFVAANVFLFFFVTHISLGKSRKKYVCKIYMRAPCLREEVPDGRRCSGDTFSCLSVCGVDPGDKLQENLYQARAVNASVCFSVSECAMGSSNFVSKLLWPCVELLYGKKEENRVLKGL